MKTVGKIVYDVDELEDMTQNHLLRQMIYRQDRATNPNAENDVIAAENKETVEAIVNEYALDLTEAGFPDLAAQILEVIS